MTRWLLHGDKAGAFRAAGKINSLISLASSGITGLLPEQVALHEYFMNL
jgi:hypothetical protein